MSANKLIVALILLIVVSGVFSCKRDKKKDDTAQVSFRLTDAPGNYDAVYIDIQKIEFKMSGREDVVLFPYRRGVYNLLSFRNGTDTLLANFAAPVGNIEQVRLILGDNSSIVDDGQTYLLNTPSAQESGVKLNLHTEIRAGVAYDIWLDFDAAKSIVKTGSGKYKLKPVIRAYSIVTNGKIEGTVLPLNAFATVYAIKGTDTAAAIPSRFDGHFVIGGLTEGSYRLIVDPGVPVYLPFEADVHVSFGTIANVGTVTLLP